MGSSPSPCGSLQGFGFSGEKSSSGESWWFPQRVFLSQVFLGGSEQSLLHPWLCAALPFPRPSEGCWGCVGALPGPSLLGDVTGMWEVGLWPVVCPGSSPVFLPLVQAEFPPAWLPGPLLCAGGSPLSPRAARCGGGCPGLGWGPRGAPDTAAFLQCRRGKPCSAPSSELPRRWPRLCSRPQSGPGRAAGSSLRTPTSL